MVCSKSALAKNGWLWLAWLFLAQFLSACGDSTNTPLPTAAGLPLTLTPISSTPTTTNSSNCLSAVSPAPFASSGISLALKCSSPASLGHTDYIFAVAFSSDGKTLASSSLDGTIRLWDVATRKQKVEFAISEASPANLAFSPDGKILAVTDYTVKDTILRFWDLTTNTELPPLKGKSILLPSVAFSPDGKFVVVGLHNSNDSIIILDFASRKEILTIKGSSQSLALSPDGKTLAIGGGTRRNIKLLEFPSGNEISTYSDSGIIDSVAFSPDGKIIASGNSERVVKLRETVTGKELATFTGHIGGIGLVAFSPDGKIIASSGYDNTMKLWDIETKKELATISVNDYGFAFSPDGKTIAAGSGDRDIKLWQLPDGKELATFPGNISSAYSVIFTPDGQNLISAGNSKLRVNVDYLKIGQKSKPEVSSNDIIKIWDTVSGKELKSFQGGSPIAITADGKTSAYVTHEATIKLRDMSSGRELLTMEGHPAGANSLAFSPDGKILASVGGYPSISIGCPDIVIKLWNTSNGKLLQSFTSYPAKPIKNLGNHHGWERCLTAVAFSPDGKLIASGSYSGIINLLDATTGKVLITIESHVNFPINSLSFSPDGQKLVSGTDDNNLKTWEIPSGRELTTFSGHNSGVNVSVFSPDGKMLATAGFDNTIKLWDAENGSLLFSTTSQQTPKLKSVAFSPNGKLLVSGHYDNSVKIWNIAK